MPKVIKTCSNCGKQFGHFTSNGPGKFCSKKCYWKNLKGKDPEHLHTPEIQKKAGLSQRGKFVSEETRLKQSEAQKKRFKKENPWNKGLTAKDNPIIGVTAAKARKAKEGMSAWNKGLTKETDKRVAKYSKSLKGMKKWWQSDEKHHAWKGDNVGYISLHTWIARKLGRPNICQLCGKSGFKRKEIDWANKNHKYKRNLNDWLRLSKSCHFRYDKRGFRKGNVIWKKSLSQAC